MTNDAFVEVVSEREFISRDGGSFRRVTYRNTLDGAAHHALIKGDIDPDKLHVWFACMLDIDRDVYLATDKIWRLVEAQKIVDAEGQGVIVLMNQPPAWALNAWRGKENCRRRSKWPQP